MVLIVLLLINLNNLSRVRTSHKLSSVFCLKVNCIFIITFLNLGIFLKGPREKINKKEGNLKTHNNYQPMVILRSKVAGTCHV